MSEDKLTELRRSRLGFVFQAFNLLPSLDRGAERAAAHAVSPGSARTAAVRPR